MKMRKLSPLYKALKSENQPPELKPIKSTIKLTTHQKQIILLILDGWSDQKISQLLFVAQRTVESHVRNIFKILEIRNRIELIVYIRANPNLISNDKSKENEVNAEICILKEQRLKAAWALSALNNEINDQLINHKLETILRMLQPELNTLEVFWGGHYNEGAIAHSEL